MHYVVENLDELERVAADILHRLEMQGAPHVLLLTGDLGVGKTTLVQKLGALLGVSLPITSPTLVLMKSYVCSHSMFTSLTHIDLYRIEDPSEVQVLTLPELYNDATRLICIEWPERAPGAVPPDALLVTLTLMPDGSRTITYAD